MQTVIYKFNSYQIVKITSDAVEISDVQDDEDFCPLPFFEHTEEGKKALEIYKFSVST